MGTGFDAAVRASSPLRWLKVTKIINKQTVAGASQPSANGRSRLAATGRANRRALSPADGRRGVQERNCVSQEFNSFIRLSFQTGSEFLQAITITARHRVRGKLQQLTHLLKGVAMPDFQNNDFALFPGQFAQAAHGGPFMRRLVRRPLEPMARLQLPRQPSPQTAPVVERAIAEAA